MPARPFIIAGALLASAGHGPALSAKIDNTFPWRLQMPTLPTGDVARFALRPVIDAVTKPVVFDDIGALARHIERRRIEDGQGHAIQLEEVEDLELPGSPDLHRGVQIWLLDLDNSRDRSLGYAWLDGKGRDTLEPALRRVRQPDRRAA